MTPAQQIALWADKLRDISAMGLRFCQNVYDRENYEKLQRMALEMYALALKTSLDTVEPLRESLLTRPTPFSTGDAAIIDNQGHILLIQRADNQKWAMPGGALAVGETPAEGVIREVFEETGLRCEPVALVGVHDSRYCGSETLHHLYHFLFLCRPMDGRQRVDPPLHAQEVLDVAWFPKNSLPQELDPGHISRIPEAFRVWQGDLPAYFDR